MDPAEAIFSKVKSIPTLPTVVHRIMEVTGNSKSASEDLVKVLESDQALTTEILKLANSAFYGFMRKISSLKQAVTVLGFTEIRNLVMARAVFNAFRNLDGVEGFKIGRFWEHALVTALAARTIAKDVVGRMEQNEFFVAGLVHDVGKLVMVMAEPDRYAEAMRAGNGMQWESKPGEKAVFGVAHDRVGFKLLQRWMFPESLFTAAQYHHGPGLAKVKPLFALVTHSADLLAHRVTDSVEDEGALVERLLASETATAWQAAGLTWTEAVVETYTESVRQVSEEEGEMLKLFLS